MSKILSPLNRIVVSLIEPANVARDNQAKTSGFLHYPLRQATRILNLLYRRTKQTDGDFQRSPYGPWLKVREDDTFTFCMRGEYGYTYAQHLRKRSKPFIFMDIGANIGLYSLIALENSATRHVHSFDPDSDSLSYLTANLERINKRNWTVHPVAVSTTSGTMTLNRKSGHSGASTLENPTFETANQESITVVNHEYLNERITPGDTDIVVKIDVEGHELSVLNALEKSDWFTQITEIFAEFDVRMSDPVVTEEWLSIHGFTKVMHLGDTSHWDALYKKNAH